jgi:hypothetical protein
MTYAIGGRIDASDYNTFTGPSSTVSTAANALNTVFGVGTGTFGYGQAPIPTVTTGQRVNASNWATLINTVSSLANHQNSSITAITLPTAGQRINFLPALATNLSTIYTNKNNASGQGITTPSTATYNATWSNVLTITFTCTFASGNHARYFFNAGGQFAINFSHPTGSGINGLMSNLASASGTIYISSPSSGVVSIAGTNFNGVNKFGGSGTPVVLSSNLGYYGLNTTNQTLFLQRASTGPAGYLQSFLSVSARTNGTQGSNGDTGNVITVTVTFDQVPNGLVVSTGTSSTLTVRYPATSYLANSWGTVTVSSSGSGS